MTKTLYTIITTNESYAEVHGSKLHTDRRAAWRVAREYKTQYPGERVFVCELPDGPGGTACFEVTLDLWERQLSEGDAP